MPDIQIRNYALHRIDLDNDEIGERFEIGDDSDFDSYVEKLMEDMYESSRFKAYKFSSEETEVVRQVVNLATDSWEERSQVIAARLFRTEKATQERMQHIVSLRVGSLVQIFAEVDGQKSLILTKVDHDNYLDESTLKEKLGLPINQRVQKTAIICADEDNSITDIRLSDTNNKISQYWWRDFLEVEELKSSEKNTSLAFNAIDKTLRTNVHKVSRSDFWALRNAVVSYFRINENFTFDTLVGSIFRGYTPDSQEVNMEQINNKMRELPRKVGFDTQFEISHGSIKAKIKDQIKLADNLELKFTGEVQDLDSLIDTGQSTDGRKYIKIYSETGYREFCKESETVS